MMRRLRMQRAIAAGRLLRSDRDSGSLAEIEKYFFASIQLPNRTYKETHPHRLDDINQRVLDYLQAAGTPCHRILDVGVSSGISTWELQEMMKQNGFRVRITAADLLIRAYRVRLFYGLHALVDRQANILQIDLGGYGIGHWYQEPGKFKDRLKHYFKRFYASFMKKGIQCRIQTSDPCGREAVPFLLLTRSLADYQEIGILEHDFLKPFPATHQKVYDYVRVANTLNLAYFSAGDIRAAVQNLKDCLSGPKALLCIVRTDYEGLNHGSLYALDERQRLQKVLSIHNGSEIDRYIDQA